MSHPFKEGIPSVFIIVSPFQALCAIEAIHEFKLKEYLFVLCLIEDIRNEQLFNLMNKYKLPYVIEWIQGNSVKKELLKIIKHVKSKYHRAFIGDYDSFWLKIFALKYLSYNSDIVYIDDGTRIIPYLKGTFQIRKYTKTNIALSLLSKLKYVRDKGCFFTLFSDLALPKFICRNNSLKYLSQLGNQSNNSNGIYIIGTNTDIYCQKLNLEKEKYKTNLEELFSYVEKKYSNEKITYIQHGRDQNSFIKEFCKKHKFEYIRPEITVELMIMDLQTSPSAVFAYTSTALFNIKKIFPNTLVYNILCEQTQSVFYNVYIEYSNYFEKHGIINLKQSDLRKLNAERSF